MTAEATAGDAVVKTRATPAERRATVVGVVLVLLGVFTAFLATSANASNEAGTSLICGAAARRRARRQACTVSCQTKKEGLR